MKRRSTILSIIAAIVAIMAMPVRLTASHAIIQEADSAYTRDDFSLAATLYSQAIDSLGSSAALYYNLGNAYYRLGRPGLAIVNYERALRLDPSNRNARENLEFVNGRITDQVGDSGTFLSNTFERIITLAHPDTWGWLALGSFVLLIGSVALYVFSSSVPLRKTGFFGGLILLFVTVGANIIAYCGARRATSHTTAIVTVPSTILSTSPRTPKDRTEEAFLLHEGTRVEILDSVSAPADTTGLKWYEVSVDNTHRAWISSKAVEKI